MTTYKRKFSDEELLQFRLSNLRRGRAVIQQQRLQEKMQKLRQEIQATTPVQVNHRISVNTEEITDDTYAVMIDCIQAGFTNVDIEQYTGLSRAYVWRIARILRYCVNHQFLFTGEKPEKREEPEEQQKMYVYLSDGLHDTILDRIKSNLDLMRNVQSATPEYHKMAVQNGILWDVLNENAEKHQTEVPTE